MRHHASWLLLLLAVNPLPAPSQEPPDAQPQFRLQVPVRLVLLNVRVSAEDEASTRTLTADRFTVLEDGKAQGLRYFENPQVRARIALVLDVSGSTREKIPEVRRATEEFLQQLSPADEVALFTVGPTYELARDFTADRGQLSRTLNRLDTQPGSGTQLYDAIGKALEVVQPDPGRSMVVVFSDGMDTNSALAFPALRQRLLQGAGALYAISLNTLEDERKRLEGNLSRVPPEKRLVVVLDFSASGERRRAIAGAADLFFAAVPGDARLDLLIYRPSGLRMLANRSRPDQVRGLLESAGEAVVGRAVVPRLGQGPATLQHRGTGENIFVFTDNQRSGLPGLEAYLPVQRARVFPVEDEEEAETLQERIRHLVAVSVGAEREWTEDLQALPGFFAESQERLRLLAEESGGQYLPLENVKRLGEAYRAVAAELRGTYLLGYYTAAGFGYHRLQVSVHPPSLRVRSRTGFFVPFQPE